MFSSGITPASQAAPDIVRALNAVAALDHRSIPGGEALNIKYTPRRADQDADAYLEPLRNIERYNVSYLFRSKDSSILTSAQFCNGRMRVRGELTPLISDIGRGSTVDGPGLRTVVFFKGCPLRCVWCHNPECMLARRELVQIDERCGRCGGASIAAQPVSCPRVAWLDARSGRPPTTSFPLRASSPGFPASAADTCTMPLTTTFAA